MKKFLSKFCIFTGFCSILIAVFLFVQNERTELKAEISTNDALVEIFDKIMQEESKNSTENEFNKEMNKEENKEILINDNLYSFILNIPSQNLTLPVQSNWSYENLELTPCVYHLDPLVVLGHNYKVHFGKLINLNKDDIVSLEYFNGDIDEYKVVAVTEIHETDTQAVNNVEYDLTLFTCNYSNNSERILVGLVKK